jgi:hypothetical protein
MVTEVEMFVSPEHMRSVFVYGVGLKRKVKERKVYTGNELLAGILDAAAGVNKLEDQLRRKTRDLRTRVANCTEVGGEVFENSL